MITPKQYTCQLYIMRLSIFKIFVILSLILALTSSVDSVPATPSPEQPTTPDHQPSSEAKVQPQTNQPTDQNSVPQPGQNPNIVVDGGQAAPTTHQEVKHQVPVQQNLKTINTAHLQEEHTKQKIKDFISQMNEEELRHFESQLAGDARTYYQKLRKEDEEKEKLQQMEYQQDLQQVVKQQTKTQIQSGKEYQQFNEEKEKFQDYSLTYHEYLFELDEESAEDFRVTIPHSQELVFYGYTYQNIDGVYSVTGDIQQEEPIRLIVYENNHRIVYQKSFYFRYFGSFQGFGNSSYHFRFMNMAGHKLIAFNMGVMFEQGHSQNKLSVNDVANHPHRLKVFREQVSQRFNDVGFKSTMQNENRQNLIHKLDRYFIYSIVEIVIVFVVCIMQVEFIKKLLSPTSVV